MFPQFGAVGTPLKRSVIQVMLRSPSTHAGSSALTSVLLRKGGCSFVHRVTSALWAHQSFAVWTTAAYGPNGSHRLCEIYTGPVGLTLPMRCAARMVLNGSACTI